MACGDRYKFLAVTSSGYTFEKPYGSWAWSKDYEEWVALATRLETMANAHHDQLAHIECQFHHGTNCGTAEAHSSSWVKWNALIPLVTQLRQQVDDLPSSWVQWNISEGIQEAMAAVATALCLMEESDKAIESYGGKPTVVPGLVPKAEDDLPWWLWPLVGAGATLVVGAVGYGLYQRSRAGRSRREPPVAQPRPASAEGRPVARRPTGAANPRTRSRKRELKAA